MAELRQQLQGRWGLVSGGFGVAEQRGADPVAAEFGGTNAVGHAVDVCHQGCP